jgi:hypothetical protein
VTNEVASLISDAGARCAAGVRHDHRLPAGGIRRRPTSATDAGRETHIAIRVPRRSRRMNAAPDAVAMGCAARNAVQFRQAENQIGMRRRARRAPLP